jgi:DNA-binding NarL/FixJ family response regulator
MLSSGSNRENLDAGVARTGRLRATPAEPGLHGRSAECAALDGLLKAIRGGESRSLVLSGVMGIGKTALLGYLTASAGEFTVLRAAGVECEMELPYASLHQLCVPLLARLDRLPAPQAAALRVVFALAPGAAPDRFLVGLGVLTLLSAAAENRPVLVAVDDAQWLDEPSALTLAFVARRLVAQRVGVVFAAREPGTALAHIAELPVPGLAEPDAGAVLRSAVRFGLDEQVRARVIAEARGNPLALLELRRGLTATELAGGFGLIGAGEVPGAVEESVARRVAALPDDARSLLLLAAADATGDPLLLRRAAERLGLGRGAAAAAEQAGLLTVTGVVTFGHPLVRSAVYRAAPGDRRRAAHLALAEEIDGERDPDRRAWHLALAAGGPDEEVALELERSAGRAQSRGGMAAAAAFLQRALVLTCDATKRVDRALAAAEMSLGAGEIDVARGLLSAAEAGPLDARQRARVDLLRAEASYAEGRGGAAPASLLRAARALDALDPALAREAYLDAWGAALFAGRLASPVGLAEISREALVVARRPGAEGATDRLLEGLAADGFAGGEVTSGEALRWGWLGTAAAAMVWDLELCLTVAGAGLDAARDAGALTSQAVSLNAMSQALVLAGDFRRARILVAEADDLTEATGTQVAPYGALVLAGLRGREVEAAPLIDATISASTASGQGAAVQFARWAHSLLLNGLGGYREAIPLAAAASEDTPELFVAVWASVELVEAASRSAEPEPAHRALERVEAGTSDTTSDWARGIQARCRALLADGAEADRLYREAITVLSRTILRPDTARAHLLYGEWLRRESRRVDARAHLRTALTMFEAIGMAAFAERARGELLATGERVRKRTVETRDELTPQELQIAHLARDGLSNRAIGARLFLSPRTVEWHLRKVFGKLGITTRRELRASLPGHDTEPARP